MAVAAAVGSIVYKRGVAVKGDGTFIIVNRPAVVDGRVVFKRGAVTKGDITTTVINRSAVPQAVVVFIVDVVFLVVVVVGPDAIAVAVGFVAFKRRIAVESNIAQVINRPAIAVGSIVFKQGAGVVAKGDCAVTLIINRPAATIVVIIFNFVAVVVVIAVAVAVGFVAFKRRIAVEGYGVIVKNRPAVTNAGVFVVVFVVVAVVVNTVGFVVFKRSIAVEGEGAVIINRPALGVVDVVVVVVVVAEVAIAIGFIAFKCSIVIKGAIARIINRPAVTRIITVYIFHCMGKRGIQHRRRGNQPTTPQHGRITESQSCLRQHLPAPSRK